jgi:hypothetical protein
MHSLESSGAKFAAQKKADYSLRVVLIICIRLLDSSNAS